MIDRIIAATPVYSTPAAKPHRYVLVERILTINMPGDSLKKGDIYEYVVCREMFGEVGPSESIGYVDDKPYPVYQRTQAREKFILAYKTWLEHACTFEEYVDNYPTRFLIHNTK